MNVRDMRVSRGMLVATVALFSLPFVTVSCGAQQVTLSGAQMVTGTTIFNEVLPPQIDVVGVLLAALTALGVTWLGGRLVRPLLAFLTAVGFGLMLFFKLRFDYAVEHSNGPISVNYGSGFWLVMLLLGVAAVINVVALLRPMPTAAPHPSVDGLNPVLEHGPTNGIIAQSSAGMELAGFEHIWRNKRFLGIAGAVLLAAVGWRLIASSLPSDAEQAFQQHLAAQCMRIGGECEPAKVLRSLRLPINEASRRNGVEDAWCIEYAQLRTAGGATSWNERKDVMVGTKWQGRWDFSGGLLNCDAMMRMAQS